MQSLLQFMAELLMRSALTTTSRVFLCALRRAFCMFVPSVSAASVFFSLLFFLVFINFPIFDFHITVFTQLPELLWVLPTWKAVFAAAAAFVTAWT